MLVVRLAAAITKEAIHRLHHASQLLASLRANRGVLLRFQEPLLAFEFSKIFQALARERLGVHGCAYRAAGFALMAAITELAARCKFLNVAERAADSIGRIPQLQFAHPRRIDQHPTTGNE